MALRTHHQILPSGPPGHSNELRRKVEGLFEGCENQQEDRLKKIKSRFPHI